MNKTSQIPRQGGEGVFIVIEGTDGSGKGTQFELLKRSLIEQGYEVTTFDFPQYNNDSSYFVKEYLNGAYGTSEDVGPYTGSLFYALDRYEAASKIRQALQDGKIVLCNRFTGSNMAHQGTKFKNAEERRGYFIWLDNLEFELLGIPRPHKNFVLRVPAETAQEHVDKKGTRSYTDKKRDIHEDDLTHLQKSVEVYDDLCQLFPKDFERIDCVRNGALLDIEAIHKMILEKTLPLLKPLERKKEESMNEAELLRHSERGAEITEDGYRHLEGIVTNPAGAVYAFKPGGISNDIVAAAMARLSRRPGDMRVTILDEFTGHEGKEEDLLRRVITAYGDDSVQQLTSMHFVVEGASNILTKQLEWGRLASYLEQSTRYIYFDEKDAEGKYLYFRPTTLDDETRITYETTMDHIFDNYSVIVRGLTDYITRNDSTPEEDRDGAWRASVRAQACDAARPLLPVATKSTVGIHGSAQAVEQMIMRLLSSESAEARTTGEAILEEARKVIPTFLERADKPGRGGATTAYLAQTRQGVKTLAEELLPQQYSTDLEDVTLADYWPKNEHELIADMLYEHSNLSLEEIRMAVANMSYEDKSRVFEAYVGERLNRRHKPGRALEKAHYSWDLICDYGIFRDLQRHRMVDDLQWQELTPRYGYEVPQLVIDAGLSDRFEQCFDLSAQLHSTLQAAGYAFEAQYATLLGHRMRWKVTYNAREAFHLHELRTSPQGHPGYRKLVQKMHEKLVEVHPIIGEAMKFVNQGEDPELTRLAAEKYTQFKLQQLEK